MIESASAAKLKKSAHVSMGYTRWIKKLTRFALARPTVEPREEAHQSEMRYVEALFFAQVRAGELRWFSEEVVKRK